MIRRHKYNAVPTTVDGIRFASKSEATRYAELKLLERAGKIRNLALQPKFPLVVNGIEVAQYWADFKYFEGNETVVEDRKGFETDVFKLKRKLFEAIYPGITFKVTTKKGISVRFGNESGRVEAARKIA